MQIVDLIWYNILLSLIWYNILQNLVIPTTWLKTENQQMSKKQSMSILLAQLSTNYQMYNSWKIKLSFISKGEELYQYPDTNQNCCWTAIHLLTYFLNFHKYGFNTNLNMSKLFLSYQIVKKYVLLILRHLVSEYPEHITFKILTNNSDLWDIWSVGIIRGFQTSIYWSGHPN